MLSKLQGAHHSLLPTLMEMLIRKEQTRSLSGNGRGRGLASPSLLCPCTQQLSRVTLWLFTETKAHVT